jgi:hypothetical protein
MSHPERSVAHAVSCTQSKDLRWFSLAAALLLAPCTLAQQQPGPPLTSAPARPASIATVSLEGVTVSGSLSVADGRAVIGNNGTITAGDKTAQVELTRGGNLDVCATTKVHLTTDASTPGGALMIALDHGAFEAHYTAGEYSDVILTPDLRILVSPPGQVDLSLRVNEQGDTCVDNHGNNAPYVLATNLFSGGAYRVQPNQRVLFEHGSLEEVVDNEREPCSCPPPTPPASVASESSGTSARPAAKQNPFPLAESEGLAPPPAVPTTPAVPPGQVETEVQAPLTYNSAHPELPPEPREAANSASSAAAPAAAKPHRGFFRRVGHFFRRIFGGK